MQVAVHHGRGAEATVPIGGELGPAPLGEFGIAQHPGRLTDQWPVIDQYQRHVRIAGEEPSFGLGDPGMAPCFPARIRIWVQEDLVGADDAGLMRVGQRLLLGVQAIDAECVVIEQKQRRDPSWATRTLPDRVGILRCDHTRPAAEVHQVLVTGLTP